MSGWVPKPRSERYRRELTRLPELHRRRKLVRKLFMWVIKLVVRLLLRVEVQGQQYFHQSGPLLIVANHLGDADVLLGLAYAPQPPEIVAKVELSDLPVIGWLMDCYGVIWLHRGLPDRRALRAILEALSQGRQVAIAPEGRESVTGGLEAGTGGAAYLAIKAGVGLLPVVFTGTENVHVFSELKHLRRPKVTITAGPPFCLPEIKDRKQAVEQGTDMIMQTLAQLLPEQYRGIYQETVD